MSADKDSGASTGWADRLVELEALANAASPGPWAINDRNEYGDLYVGSADDKHDWFSFAHPIIPGRPHRENAEFIVAARAAIPELIAEIRRLRAKP